MKNIYCLNLKCSVSLKFKSLISSLGVILIATLLITPTSDLYAAFNKHELKVMSESIEGTFKLLIDTWNEELYFEMYDFGQRQSQQHIARGEFAQRMVELKWKPTLTPIEIDRIDILYLNYAIIYFWQEFENKVNLSRKIRKYMVFPVILESNNWKFNLTQLIRIPYEGAFDKPDKPTRPQPEQRSDQIGTPGMGQDPAQVPGPPAANP